MSLSQVLLVQKVFPHMFFCIFGIIKFYFSFEFFFSQQTWKQKGDNNQFRINLYQSKRIFSGMYFFRTTD